MNINEYMTFLPQIQATQTKMLSDFHDFCLEYDLKYILIWGTLLGAIRHDGFIPWDDDIDIGMPREDYEKFLQLKDKLSDNYFVQNYLTDQSFFPFTKLRLNGSAMVMNSSKSENFHHGIWIDIFPLDQMPEENGAEFKSRYKKIAFLQIAVTSNSIDKVKSAKNAKNKVFRLAFYFINKLFGRNFFINKLENELKRDCASDKLYSCSEFSLSNKDQLVGYHIEDINQRVLHKFEDCNFYIPKNATNYLEMSYGDYMQFPDEKSRFPHHVVVKLEFPDNF